MQQIIPAFIWAIALAATASHSLPTVEQQRQLAQLKARQSSGYWTTYLDSAQRRAVMAPVSAVVSPQRERRQVVATKPQASANPKKASKNFEQDCLIAHNKYRRLHQAGELIIDNKIKAFAQKRADYIAASDGSEFKHPPDLPFGENLAWHSNSGQSCAALVKMWYDELGLYNFRAPGFDHETGHLTQLVWRDTTRVGCARAISQGPKGGVYLVCNYDPPGNYLGEFPQNVLPPKANQPPRATVTTPVSTTSTTTTTTTTTPKPPTSTTSRAVINPSGSSPASFSTSTSSSSSSTEKPKEAKKKPKGKKKNKKNKNKKKNKSKGKKKGNKKTTTTSTTSKPINVTTRRPA